MVLRVVHMIQVIINSIIQMSENAKVDDIIESMDQEAAFIEANRVERNKKYVQCMSDFKDFLKKETQQLQSSQVANNENKALISDAFESTFERVLNASDLTIRKIKHTFNQKKIFWDNVIKSNADISDIELKKEFYAQKKNAEEGYLEAADRQKDKHKTYKVLISMDKKKEHLREYQQTNKTFQEKVKQGSNTLQQWQNLSKTSNNYYGSVPYQQSTKPILNEFIDPAYLRSNNDIKIMSADSESSGLFLNNFQIRK